MPANSIVIATIDSSKICIADYQRGIDSKRVKRIADTWKDEVANPPKVSYRGGKYWVFDGQHTIAARKLRNGNQDLPIECRVYSGLTYEEEAELFVLQNGIAKNPDVNAKFKAMYEAGDVDIIEFKRTVESIGLKMDFSKSQGQNKIIACRTAYKLFTKNPTSKIFVKSLEMIKFAWGGAPDSFRNEILLGMEKFVDVYWGVFKENRLTSSLSNIDIDQFVKEAKRIPIPGSNNVNVKCATQMVRIYNANNGKKTRDKLDEGLLYK